MNGLYPAPSPSLVQGIGQASLTLPCFRCKLRHGAFARLSTLSTSSCFMLEICFKCVEDVRDQSSLWDNLNPAPVKYAGPPQCPSSYYGPHNHYQVRLWVLLSDPIRSVVRLICAALLLHCTGNRLTPLSAQEERHTWSSLRWDWVSISNYITRAC